MYVYSLFPGRLEGEREIACELVLQFFTFSFQELLKTVRGILNKLTPSKFDKLLARIQSLNIDSEDRLAGVIKLFFEKVFFNCINRDEQIRNVSLPLYRLWMNRSSPRHMQKCVTRCRTKKSLRQPTHPKQPISVSFCSPGVKGNLRRIRPAFWTSRIRRRKSKLQK